MIEKGVSLFQQEQADDDNKKTYGLISVGSGEDEDTSLAIDTQQLHRSTQQHNQAMQGKGGRKEEKGEKEEEKETREENKRRKGGQVEKEKGRKGQGERSQAGRKEEEEKEVLGERSTQVKKDVTELTVVTRNRRQKKMIQIFVKVNESQAFPLEVSTDDKVEGVMKRFQEDEDAHVTMQGKVLRTSEKLKSCGVADGCTIQVTSRMRGGGRHKEKKNGVKRSKP